MKTILTFPLFAFAFSLALQAIPYYAVVTTVGAKGEWVVAGGAYTAYYCTKDAAAAMFEGNVTYDTVTAYLTKDEATYLKGMDALATGGTALDNYGFDEGEYSFSKYVQTGLAGDYLAVLAYAADASNEKDMVRVFSATADVAGGLTFDPAAGQGAAGSWTTVPEPTSGMLLLLGVAGLALKRKQRG